MQWVVMYVLLFSAAVHRDALREQGPPKWMHYALALACFGAALGLFIREVWP